MEVRAIGKFIKVSPFKARLVADLIRGKKVNEALAILKYSPKKASRIFEKLINSAMANAENNHKIDDVEKLFVSTVFVDHGPTMKRFMPRAMGRATRILKRTSHITVKLQETNE